MCHHFYSNIAVKVKLIKSCGRLTKFKKTVHRSWKLNSEKCFILYIQLRLSSEENDKNSMRHG